MAGVFRVFSLSFRVSVENCLVCVSLGYFPRDPFSVEEGWVYRLLLVQTCSLSPLRSLLGEWSKVSFLTGTDSLGGIFRQALAEVRKVFSGFLEGSFLKQSEGPTCACAISREGQG